MSQKQKVIDVRLKDGSIRKGISTGNNAAWICVCGRADPLLGRSGLLNGLSEGFRVDCPECDRKYFVMPDGRSQGPVLEIIEVD